MAERWPIVNILFFVIDVTITGAADTHLTSPDVSLFSAALNMLAVLIFILPLTLYTLLMGIAYPVFIALLVPPSHALRRRLVAIALWPAVLLVLATLRLVQGDFVEDGRRLSLTIWIVALTATYGVILRFPPVDQPDSGAPPISRSSRLGS